MVSFHLKEILYIGKCRDLAPLSIKSLPCEWFGNCGLQKPYGIFYNSFVLFSYSIPVTYNIAYN